MLKLPVNFQSSATASGDPLEPWLIQSGAHSAMVSIPPEFGGQGGGFSPEDLFLQALINCFIGTFKVYAKGSKIYFTNLEVSGNLKIDLNSSGAVRMQTCDLKIDIFDVEKPDRVKALVEKVFRDGFILNSVKTEIHHSLVIHEVNNVQTSEPS